MKICKKSILLLGAAAVCMFAILVFCACGGGINERDTVYIGTTALIERAVRGEYNYDMLASGNSDMPLVSQTADGNYKPLIATYSTVDSKTWTFTVLENLKWSDGAEVTAEDILFTLNYNDAHGEAVFNDKTADNDGSIKITRKKYESYLLSADKRSISLTLVAANIRELSNMTSFRIVPKHIYENKSDGEITAEDGRVVCGPYVLTRFDRESGTLVYGINPHYPQMPTVKRLVYRLFSEPDIMYMSLQNGDIDTVWNYSQSVSETYLEALKQNGNLKFYSTTAKGVRAVLMFNNGAAPFDDAHVRRAISYALDYDMFKSMFGGENASVANRGFAPMSTVGYKSTEKLQKNWETAARCLSQSGYVKPQGARYYSKNGVNLAFSLTVRSSNALHLRYAELVKNQLEAFGIAVSLDAVDSNAFNVKTSNKFAPDGHKSLAHQAAINGFTEAGMGMGNGLGAIYVDKKHAVQGGCQAEGGVFSDIMSELASANTVEAYEAAAGRLQDYYSEETPLIALFWDNLTYVCSSSVKNVIIDGVFGINNVENWLSVVKE